MVGEGYPVQFVVLSDVNAEDFIGRTDVPIFRDPTSGVKAWKEMSSIASKHDTFVFDRTGARILFWDATAHRLADWETDIRGAVEASGK
jgi:hypothetical protein